MGVVYAAEDTKLARTIALKILPADLAADPERRARFEREARAVASLNHPNIVTIYSIEEDDGTLFLTMELVRGRTLAELFEPGGLGLDTLLDIAVPLADALAAAHEQGITHRDVKPQNVMVTSEGRVKVLDFGLAKLARAPHVEDDTVTMATTVGRVMGTIPYMSPEQIRGQPVDARSDLFSLGTVLYELAAGHRPFQGNSAAELISSILRDAPQPVTELRPELGSGLNPILQRCLEKDPAHRPQRAADLRDELAALRHDPGAPVERFVPSIAVLPFRDRSPAQDQAYLCEGMAEELIRRLAGIPGLRVASRMSSFQFKTGDGDRRDIGRRLGVAGILEGSVSKLGDRLRITAELVDVASGYQRWSERYDRQLEDVFTIQDEIAANIVGALRPTLAPESALGSRKAPAANAEAYDFYLRGRHQAARRTSTSAQRALEMFARAIEIDPDYGLAYAGIADCHSLLHDSHGGHVEDLERADAASRKAIELAPDLAESHVSRGLALALARRFDEAATEYKAAMRLNPAHFEAYYGAAHDQLELGRLEEAAALLEQASRVSPEDYQALGVLSLVYRRLGRDKDAMRSSRRQLAIVEKQLALNPDDARARIFGANALLSLGERDRSLDWTARAVVLDPDGPDTLYNAACACARAGETESALQLLEKLAQGGHSDSQKKWMEDDPDFASLKDHPRFRRLLAVTAEHPSK
jgi:TolB-like protein/Flp pilus assembly protein TadD